MLVACRLAGLSALGAHYAGVKLQAMRAEHGTTHQDHAGTSRAALDIEHRTSQRMGMRADGRPPVRLDIDIDIDTGNADGEDGPQGCPGARGRQGPSVHVRNRGDRATAPTKDVQGQQNRGAGRNLPACMPAVVGGRLTTGLPIEGVCEWSVSQKRGQSPPNRRCCCCC